MRRLRWLLMGAGVAGAIAWVLLRVRKGSPPEAGSSASLNGHAALERRSRSDPEALQALAEGTVTRVGLDLDRLKELKSANYKPLMEYLGYIQVQRGGNETLLFVRLKDLDELADLAGQSRDDFVKQFRRLGVLLSMN